MAECSRKSIAIHIHVVIDLNCHSTVLRYIKCTIFTMSSWNVAAKYYLQVLKYQHIYSWNLQFMKRHVLPYNPTLMSIYMCQINIQ